MNKYIIYGYVFKRTAKFAPECYEVYDSDGEKLADIELKWGVLSMQVSNKRMACDLLTAWEIPDLNCFHTEERRNKWLTAAAKKLMEVQKEYGS